MARSTDFLVALAIVVTMLGITCHAVDYNKWAKDILASAPLVDGHNDLPLQFRVQWNDTVWGKVDLHVHQPTLDTDIPRLKAGGVGGQFWSVFVPCNMQSKDAVRATMEQIDVVYKLTERYPENFEIALTANDITKAFANGKVASLIGIEGGHSIDSSLGALRQFYRLGVRYMGLTHNCNTPWAESCCAGAPVEMPGLTPFGRNVVTTMNRLGMIVDLAHVSAKTMHDVLDISTAPVIFSHSNAYSVCPTARNVPDSVLERLKQNQGVVMVNFYPNFVTCTSNSTIPDVVNMINYLRNKCGVTCVGLGADYDGIETKTVGLEDVSTYPSLVAALLQTGSWSESDIKQLIGGNVIRVLAAVEAEAQRVNASKMESVIYPSFTTLEKTCRSPPETIKDEEDDQ